MTRTTQPTSVQDERRWLLDLERSFLHAIAARVQQLDSVLDPRTGELLCNVRLCPCQFERHAGTDSQLAHRALLRNGYTAHEIEPIINAMPVNAAVAWSVEAGPSRRLRQPQWRATGIVIAGACWSPLVDIAQRTIGELRPMQTTDATQLVDRMRLASRFEMVWLALASTTGWQEVALGACGANVHGAYFQPALDGGWALRATSPAPGVDMSWLAGVIHPEDDVRLHGRAQGWFSTAGRTLAMSPGGLTVDDVVTHAGVPVDIARAFLERTTLREPGRWAYEAGPQRLIFLGP